MTRCSASRSSPRSTQAQCSTPWHTHTGHESHRSTPRPSTEQPTHTHPTQTCAQGYARTASIAPPPRTDATHVTADLRGTSTGGETEQGTRQRQMQRQRHGALASAESHSVKRTNADSGDLSDRISLGVYIKNRVCVPPHNIGIVPPRRTDPHVPFTPKSYNKGYSFQ